MSSPEVHVTRRKLFVSLAAVTATAAAVPLTRAQAYGPGDDELRPRYREDSPDVQAFYRTNGYES